jgi:alcohol dehydrogenase (cytochrome c)
MRNSLPSLTLLFVAVLTSTATARQIPAPSPTADGQVYATRCGTCHGAKMTGGAALSILTYVRYHSDAEVTAVLRTRMPAHPAVTLTADQLTMALAEMRVLAGTNPAMAVSGYTGTRARGGGGGGGRGGPATGRVSNAPATITLADGRTLTGVVRGEWEFDEAVLADGKFHLLAKDGDTYREKSIAPKSDWLTYHGSLTGNRFSALDQINLGNVHALAPAWMFTMQDLPRFEVTPVVADGIMYVTGWNELYALDATTGRQLWSYNEPQHPGITSEAGIGANRGAAIGGDKVFMVTDHAHLLAFNRFTGARQWDVEMASYAEGNSSTVAPLVVGDLVLQGVAGGEEGARGFVDAYRIATGERVWRFYTVPKRGEKGSETWKGQAIDHGCGATWETGSYDPELDLTYWGVGNPCPDYAGEERIGDNLYTSSVVALSAKTGELKWHYQFTPHDTHDWDAAQPMVLVDEMWAGRPRKLLMHGDRNGIFYVLDRATGEFLLGSDLVTKQTWNKGFTKDGKPIVDPGSIATPEGVAVCPGSNGGANWPDVSYNPATRLFYVRVADSCGVYASSPDPLTSDHRWYGRGTPGKKARQDLEALLAGTTTGNFIRALDPFTGKKVWDYPSAGRSGVLSTAGGLIFLGNTGGLVALDAKTGAPVWHINLAQNSSAAPMTYMVGGKQYIALPGNGVLVAYSLR